MTEIVPTLFEEIICPTNPDNPRNGEGSIASLTDGRLLLAWTRFLGPDDHSAAEIWGRFSNDGGYTWGERFLMQDRVGKCNVMLANLRPLQSGDLLFGYCVKNDPFFDCQYYVRRSSDLGQTWEEPVLCTTEPGFYNMLNDTLLQMRSGRLVQPAATTRWREPKAGEKPDPYHASVGNIPYDVTTCYYSDDGGRTWHRSADYLTLPDYQQLTEAGAVEFADGSLWMWMRSRLGCIYASRSSDGGEHWSEPEPTELVAPNAPAVARRLPESDDLVILYNDRRGVPKDEDRFQWRTPLTSAISSDHGHTWHSYKLVEVDESRSYCYATVAFHNDTTLLTYYVGKVGGHPLVDLKLKILPTADWTRSQSS